MAENPRLILNVLVSPRLISASSDFKSLYVKSGGIWVFIVFVMLFSSSPVVFVAMVL